MPKFTTSRNFGGQRRTIETKCGFITSGSLRESTYKWKLHKKVCDICKDITVNPDNIEFDNARAIKNGWNGIHNNNVVTKYVKHICSFDSDIHNVLVKQWK